MDSSLFKPAIVLPTYNNARTLGQIIARVLIHNTPTIVVDDGCTDATATILAEFQNRIQIVRHPRNRGKAAALRSGFAAAHSAGFTHAVTLDTDGQLDPGQIPEFIERSREHPDALIIGVRDETKIDYPSRSRTGRRISNLLVLVESGVEVSDSQCGFRVYPLGFVANVKCSAERFGFETEIITRAGWANCKIEEIAVSCTYSPVGGRVSHFRPWMDSFRAIAMHIRLIGRAICPWPHAKWPGKSSQPMRWTNACSAVPAESGNDLAADGRPFG